jgi:hypothetical protein
MPPASPHRAGTTETDPARPDPARPDPARSDPGRADPTLTAEREHLHSSREFLRLMRDDVLGLRALAGDPVSEEYLKADLYRRAEALKDLPETPLFFGRLNYAPGPAAAPGSGSPGEPGSSFAGEQFHVGRRHVHDGSGRAVVVDWRAPVSRPFYRASQAEPLGLDLRRRFGFSGAALTAYEDERFGSGPGSAPAPAAGTAASRILIQEI